MLSTTIDNYSCRHDFGPDPNNIEEEKYRYLAYSVWVSGGQGLFFFRYDHPDAEDWFGTSGNGISAQILEEAHLMKDWLMDEPADDIESYISDNRNSHRMRFILKRHQNGTDNRLLLLFCNYSNDGQSHSTYIHFPNNTFSTVDKVASHMRGTYQLIDNGQTVYFEPSDQDFMSKDVYASACFLTLSQ